MNRPSYYDILGLTTTANKEEIKSAFRKLAQKYHPDKNVATQTDDTFFLIINNAYQVLVNDLKKNEYDSYLNSVKNKGYSSFHIFKKYNPLIEKTLTEFNYILWDIEDIIRNITEEFIKTNIDGQTLYDQILDFLGSIEKGILNENDRYKNFLTRKIEKRNIENYFYLLRIEIQKHIENISQNILRIEIEQLMKIKNNMTSFISDMNEILKKNKATNR